MIQTWKVMAAVVVTGGLLLLLLLLAADAQASSPADGQTESSALFGEPIELAWTPLALVGGTALLAGGAWIGMLERAGRPCGSR